MAHGIWTALLIILFVAMIAWAWSDRRKADFDAAAQLPLQDGDEEARR